jgi:hypothetical protein
MELFLRYLVHFLFCFFARFVHYDVCTPKSAYKILSAKYAVT